VCNSCAASINPMKKIKDLTKYVTVDYKLLQFLKIDD
jgi:hypothetical protein